MAFTNEFESVTMDEWIKSHHKEDDLRSLFLNMDIALKYIHDHGYCIEVFYPTEIKVLNNDTKQIQFNKLIELSSDFALRKEIIKEDIFRSALLQIGIYSNCLNYIRPDFLKENFDSFAQFIPSGDVSYYRGVIQRGAAVYLCEYAVEKNNRDLEELEAQLAAEGGLGEGKTLKKRNGKNIGVSSISNDDINDKIYKQINNINEAAFVNLLIIPTIILSMILVFALITWILSIH